MKKLFVPFFALVIAIMLTSCGSKELKQASLIPKDANLIIVLDQKAMEEKLKAGNFQMDSLMNKFVSSVDSAKAKKLFNDWKNSGINTDEKVIMFMTQGGKKGKVMSFNFIGGIKDAAKFESFLKSQEEFKTATVVKEKTHSSLKLGNAGIASWTSDYAMISFVMSTDYGHYDEMSQSFIPGEKVDEAAFVNKFYTLKDDEKVTSIKAFNEMFNNKADAYLFTSTASIGSSLAALPVKLPKVEELLKDIHSVSYMNFENGKIDIKTTTYLNERLNNIVKQYGDNAVKLSLIENLPAKNANAAVLLSFKPEALQGILKELQLETLIDAGLSSAQVNFTLQDIYKCLNGNMGFALGDFAMQAPDSNSYGFTSPSMKILFNAEVGDKVSLAKILDEGVKKQVLVNAGGVYTISPLMVAQAKVYLRIDDKNIIVAGDENTYAQFAGKSTKANYSADFTSNLSGKTSAMFVDINSILKAFEGLASSDAHGKVIMDKALSTFGAMNATSTNLKDGKISGEFIFKMKNEKENSLVSIANFFKTIAEEMQAADKERKSRYNDMMMSDTTVAMPQVGLEK